MRIWRLALFGLVFACTGCVSGYGGCLFVSPVKHTLTGRIHFRAYPAADGMDHVPILELDHTAYLYSPAQSFSCQAANELQLAGISEFPESIVENSHVSAEGKIVASTSNDQHTHFLMNVITLLPDSSNHADSSH